MSSTQPFRNMPPQSLTFDTRTSPPKILFAGADYHGFDALKKLTEEAGYSLIAAGENDVISMLFTYDGIAVVVADLTSLINRCALGLLIKEYFPGTSLLLISRDIILQGLVCTQCPVDCGSSIVDQSLAVNILLGAIQLAGSNTDGYKESGVT